MHRTSTNSRLARIAPYTQMALIQGQAPVQDGLARQTSCGPVPARTPSVATSTRDKTAAKFLIHLIPGGDGAAAPGLDPRGPWA